MDDRRTRVLVRPGSVLAHNRPRETNANRKARIARQIAETYTHRWEVAGGGGYLRFRSGEFNQKNSEIAFWLNTTYYFNQKLASPANCAAHTATPRSSNLNPFASLVGRPQISEYPFMAGPTYRFRLRQKTALSVFALGGTAIGKFDGDSKGISAANLGLWPSTMRARYSPSAATSTSTSTPTLASALPPATPRPPSADRCRTTPASRWAWSTASAARSKRNAVQAVILAKPESP